MLVFLIVGGLAFVWSWMKNEKDFMLPVASIHGKMVDDMFWLTMIILGIVFAITQILLFVYSYKYQHRDDKRAYFYSHNNRLEVFWTIIPAIVMALLVFRGWKAWTTITNPAPKDAEVVEIVGKQFNWIVRYPGPDKKLGTAKFTLIDGSNELGLDFNDKASHDDIITNEIHIPKGRPVLFKIRSRDVTHSFYSPHFRMQMHAVPGMPTRFWMTPTKSTADMANETGNPDFKYEIACNQICGRGHFAMRVVIVVDEEEEYAEWLGKQKALTATNPELLTKVQGVPAAAGKPGAEPAEAAETAEEIVREKASL
jgi:cytochrome c oxidase subunit 2